MAGLLPEPGALRCHGMGRPRQDADIREPEHDFMMGSTAGVIARELVDPRSSMRVDKSLLVCVSPTSQRGSLPGVRVPSLAGDQAGVWHAHTPSSF